MIGIPAKLASKILKATVLGLGVELSGKDGIVALIGRDLLKSAMFVYNGPDGTFALAF